MTSPIVINTTPIISFKIIIPFPLYSLFPYLYPIVYALKCKNEYLVLALSEETAVQAVVGSSVWAFCRLKKPWSREMSARGYALHSVCPQLSFPIFID